MGSKQHEGVGPGSGIWRGLAVIVLITAVAAASSGQGSWVTNIVIEASDRVAQVTASCTPGGLQATALMQDRGGAPEACRVGSVIQIVVRNVTERALYPHVVIFAHGAVASYTWPGSDLERRVLAPRAVSMTLPLEYTLTQRGATLVAVLSPTRLSEQQVRAAGRRASSSLRLDGVTTAVWRVEATGILERTGR